MSKQDKFGSLVNQLSAQAEGERVAEQAALHRQMLIRRTRRVCLWVMVACLVANGFVYREKVGKVVHQLAVEKPTVPGAEDRANKLQAVIKAAQTHADLVDAAGR